jgi:hypothetical protein
MTHPRKARRTLLLMLALVGCSLALAGCYKPVPSLTSTGIWRPYTPSSGSWNNVRVGSNCSGPECTQTQNGVNVWNYASNYNMVRTNSSPHFWVNWGYYGSTGWRGLTEKENCARRAYGRGGCTVARIYINKSYVNRSDDHGTNCHELGHVAGLGHFEGDCMGSAGASRPRSPGKPSVDLIHYLRAVSAQCTPSKPC